MVPEFESLLSIERSGSAKVNIEQSSSPSRPLPSLSNSTNRSRYASHSELIASKAADGGLDMTDFRKIMSEEEGIAKARFPGESEDWQTWLTESMVWRFYCTLYLLLHFTRFVKFQLTLGLVKDASFPGLEPERIYSLHSSNMGAPNKIRSSGAKWQKFSDPSPLKAITGVNRADSYMPSTSPLRRLDRAIPQAVDSYRPNPSKRVPTGPKAEALSRSKPLNSSGSHSNSCSRSVPSSNAVLIRANSLSNSAGTTSAASSVFYMSQEKVMERKAIAQGCRKEFFQYLQKIRVSNRSQVAPQVIMLLNYKLSRIFQIPTRLLIHAQSLSKVFFCILEP